MQRAPLLPGVLKENQKRRGPKGGRVPDVKSGQAEDPPLPDPAAGTTAMRLRPARPSSSRDSEDSSAQARQIPPAAQLPRPEPRSICAQRPRSHPESRRQRWRHVMQRRAAVAANFLLRALHAQPLPTRRTLRTQTLHRPTRQILHRSPRFDSGHHAAANPNCPRRCGRNPEKMAGL